MSADVMEVRSRLAGQYKESILHNSSVIIASLSMLIACGSLMFAGIAMYAALDAKEETEVYEIYVANLHAELRANGFTPPPLPGER